MEISDHSQGFTSLSTQEAEYSFSGLIPTDKNKTKTMVYKGFIKTL
jgi:hypothetical protein